MNEFDTATKIRILEETKAVLSLESAWAKGTYKSETRDENFKITGYTYCLAGAAREAVNGLGLALVVDTPNADQIVKLLSLDAAARKRLEDPRYEEYMEQQAFGGDPDDDSFVFTIAYNDHEDTTYEDVIGLIDEKIGELQREAVPA